MSGALSGLTVVELGGFIAGPFAGQLLGDQGARVIKIEPPTGDPLRTWGRHLHPKERNTVPQDGADSLPLAADGAQVAVRLEVDGLVPDLARKRTRGMQC